MSAPQPSTMPREVEMDMVDIVDNLPREVKVDVKHEVKKGV